MPQETKRTNYRLVTCRYMSFSCCVVAVVVSRRSRSVIDAVVCLPTDGIRLTEPVQYGINKITVSGKVFQSQS